MHNKTSDYLIKKPDAVLVQTAFPQIRSAPPVLYRSHGKTDRQSGQWIGGTATSRKILIAPSLIILLQNKYFY